MLDDRGMKEILKNIVKRKDTILFIVSLFLLFAGGCSKKNTSQLHYKPVEAPANTTTVNFIGHWLNEGIREDLVRNFAREYEFQNQHVRVNLKFPEEVFYNREDLQSNQKFVARMLAKDNPDWDIVRVNGEYKEIWQQTGDPNWPNKYLVDFSRFEEFREGTLPELLTDEAKEAWNGIIPGPFIEGQFWALWFNRNVAQKLGIEIKQYGMTCDDFLSYLKAVYRHNQNNPDDYITPIYESVDWPTTMVIGVQMYASLLNDPKELLRKKITTERLNAWGKTLETLEEMSAYEPYNPNWQNVNWGNTTASLLNEECLFYVNGSWMYNIWEGIDHSKVNNCRPAEFPVFNDLLIFPGGYQVMWAVLKNAPHKEEAINFLLAMNKPEMAERWVRYTKCPTGIKGNLTGVSFGNDQFEDFSYHIQDKYGLNTYRYFETSSWVLNLRHEETPIYFDEVFRGEMTANEAMQRINRSIGW
ncbi:MAG: ABC transporter substrate-binding protein [Prolixibacteraceae bacterium]|nr:ABC transporter substrate-binding protein [Prolixibacteraceae bacterium]